MEMEFMLGWRGMEYHGSLGILVAEEFDMDVIHYLIFQVPAYSFPYRLSCSHCDAVRTSRKEHILYFRCRF